MTRDEAIARLRCIGSMDINTRKPVPYLGEIVEACETLGLKVDAWAASKSRLVAALERIGAEKMRDTANALIPKPPARPSPFVRLGPPYRPERLHRAARQARGAITAADANAFLRSLPPADPDFLNY